MSIGLFHLFAGYRINNAYILGWPLPLCFDIIQLFLLIALAITARKALYVLKERSSLDFLALQHQLIVLILVLYNCKV